MTTEEPADGSFLGHDGSTNLFDPHPPFVPDRNNENEQQQPSSIAIGEEADPYEEADRHRTIYMTTLFLVLMVVYVGFCFWYRRGRGLRSVGLERAGDADGDGGGRDRRRQRNQAVLDESVSAASRARESAEEQAKLEQRKRDIKKALLTRLIVDEQEEGRDGRRGGKMVEGGDGAARSAAAAADASDREIITIREEEDEDDSERDEEAVSRAIDARGAKNDAREGTEEEGSEEKEKERGVPDGAKDEAAASPTLSYARAPPPLASLPPPLSPIASPTVAPPSTPPTSPIPSLPRLSLSSPKRYADALNCGGRASSCAETLNCGNGGAVVRSAIGHCSDRGGATSCGGGVAHFGLRGGGSPSPNGNGTVSLAAMTSAHGEECLICLSQFQVGDRAAWRRDDGDDDDDANDDGRGGRNGSEGDETAAGRRCDHVFHEECISRWLLVRDGCPICRRSYFSDAAEDPGDASDPSAAGDGPAAGDGSGGVGIDLELGVQRNNSGRGGRREMLTSSWFG